MNGSVLLLLFLLALFFPAVLMEKGVFFLFFTLTLTCCEATLIDLCFLFSFRLRYLIPMPLALFVIRKQKSWTLFYQIGFFILVS